MFEITQFHLKKVERAFFFHKKCIPTIQTNYIRLLWLLFRNHRTMYLKVTYLEHTFPLRDLIIRRRVGGGGGGLGDGGRARGNMGAHCYWCVVGVFFVAFFEVLIYRGQHVYGVLDFFMFPEIAKFKLYNKYSM